jgi:hypothetical protein
MAGGATARGIAVIWSDAGRCIDMFVMAFQGLSLIQGEFKIL